MCNRTMYALSLKQSVTLCLCSNDAVLSHILLHLPVLLQLQKMLVLPLYVNQIWKICASLNLELLIMPEMQLEQTHTMPFHANVPVRYYKIYSYNIEWQ